MNKNVFLNYGATDHGKISKVAPKFKSKPFEFGSEKRKHQADSIRDAFNFSHGGKSKKKKKRKG